MIYHHADCIFDRLPVGMRDWNVHVLCESALQKWPIKAADSIGVCNADMLSSCLVVMGL